jgi:acetylornithine deacetylase/succinyl-diaminopimelate desuccinylase-like protein
LDETILNWCRRLVACRSVTNEGTYKIMEFCARELLAPRGIDARLLLSVTEGPAQANLAARIHGTDSNLTPLVFNTHLDTVPPGDLTSWTECGGDPFSPIVKDGRIYGLGAADTKLDFIAKVSALTGLRPRRDVYLVATFGEEHGMVGAREIAEMRTLPQGALAYIGEASHLQVITAHKGFMVFELVLRFTPESLAGRAVLKQLVLTGRAAHSSTPALGTNAIRLALEKLRDNRNMQVVSITGGDAVNKVPSRCEVTVVNGLALEAPPLPTLSGTDYPVHGVIIRREALILLLRFIDELQQFADTAGSPEPDYAAPTLTCNPGVLRSDHGELRLEFEMRPPPAMSLDEVRQGLAAIAARLEHSAADIRIELTERRANPGFRSRLDSPTVELATAALASADLPIDLGVKAGCTEAGIYAAAGLHPVVFGPGIATGVIHAPDEYNLLSDVDGAIRFYTRLLSL